ncbi:MAG: hypothetical protein IT372_39450 [Polyangiaceae bacterium]|nr:hypothetical protein [Polyangiaceae bacterium]
MTGWGGPWGQGAGRSWDLVGATRERIAEIDAARAEIQRLRQAHLRSRAEVEARWRHAHGELLQALVPSLDPQALQRAAWLTGYAPLAHPSVLANMEAERQRLAARIAEIEADPRFAHRELYRAPRVGTLVQKLAELEHYRAPLAAVLQSADHPRLERLLAASYGTPEYAEPFWRTAYYADWKAGDEILERFPEKKTFADLRAEIVQMRDSVAVYDARIAEVRAEIAAGERLEAEHRGQREALATLPQRYLAWAREALGRHLADIDLGALGQRLAQAPDVQVLATRAAGLASKLVYLDRMAQHHLDAPEAALAQARLKLDRDVMKWSRPKMHGAMVDGDRLARRRQPLLPRYQKGFQRFQKTYTRVYVFDDYGAGRLASDFLWWDLMTDGRVDGDFIPEVRSFRERHPGYRYAGPRDAADHADDDDAAAAAAAAGWDAGGAGGAGGFAGVDAS